MAVRPTKRENHIEARFKQKGKLFTILKPVVDKFDPESLLKLGCPSNEYDSLTKEITKAICREWKVSVTELAHIIAFATHSHFNMWSRPVQMHNMYFEMAKEMLPLLTFLKK